MVSLCGALALAELSSMLPRTGGAYVFLRAAYGDPAAFTFGWLYLLVATPGGHRGAGHVLRGAAGDGVRSGRRRGRPPWALPAIAATTIVMLSVDQPAGRAAGVGGADGAHADQGRGPGGADRGVVCGRRRQLHRTCARPRTEARNLGLGAASVIWAYDGWIAVSMIAGEVRAPERQMRRIIIAGMLTIVVLYVGANVGYFYALPLEAMAGEAGGVPQRIMADRLGPLGAALIGGAILCSVFGALNGNILAKPRVALCPGPRRLDLPGPRARPPALGDPPRGDHRARPGGAPARLPAARFRPA